MKEIAFKTVSKGRSAKNWYHHALKPFEQNVPNEHFGERGLSLPPDAHNTLSIEYAIGT